MDRSAQSPYTAFEALDCYDLIEWAGTQPWSTGRVGLSGVSYLASIQWFVAALAPPHLAAINPWEGWSDTYREVARHGGIPETCFWRYLPSRWGHSVTEVEDLAAEDAEHPLYDAFWASKSAPLERITVPAFVVASWSDQGLHTRGTLEGFKQIASRQKWLEVHGRKKFLRARPDGTAARVLRSFPVGQEHRRAFLAWQPVLRHARVLPLTDGEPTCLEIEIWPSGTRFEAGEGLRLVVQGRDVYDYPAELMADRHCETVNRGAHRLFSGGHFDSHLLVPVVSL